MASTTVVTSLEQESMIMFSVRSICISRCSVSSPSISVISTSRIMKLGRSPWLTRSSASFPLATVSTSWPSTSRSVLKYLRMLGSSSTTSIFSFFAIVVILKFLCRA